MSNPQNGPAPPLSEPISEQAGFWDARLRSPECTDEDRARFQAWREADPAHRDAFERLQLLLEAFNSGLVRADVRGLRDAVVVKVERRRRRLAWTIAACAAIVALGVVLNAWRLQLFSISPTQSYITQVGQRSTVTLTDGSTVDLNADSQLQVRFSRERRSIHLLRGQAIFHVTKDALRPFVVSAANREIVAVGTAFDVRLSSTSVQVTVLEGKVSVERSDVRQRTLDPLQPGERLTAIIESTSPPRVTEVNVARVTGWRDGRVFIDDLPLSEAIAEMNRYSRTEIVVTDPALAAVRLNGMFRAGDQKAFVAALQSYFPIDASWHGDAQVVLEPRAP